MNRSVVRSAQGGAQNVPVAPGERRVVRSVEAQAHQPKQRRDEALGLPKRHVEEHAEGQRLENRQVRVARLPAPTAGRRRRPGPKGLLGEPDGDVASGAQSAFVRPPVPTRYCFLYLGFTPLDFVEAMAQLPRRHGTPSRRPWAFHAPKPHRTCTNAADCPGPRRNARASPLAPGCASKVHRVARGVRIGQRRQHLSPSLGDLTTCAGGTWLKDSSVASPVHTGLAARLLPKPARP